VGRLTRREAPAEAFAEGLKHHREGRLADAERLYRRALAGDAEHAHALHYLGVVAHYSGHSTDALQMMRQSLRLAPEVGEFHLNLGDVLHALGQYRSAEKCYIRAEKLSVAQAIVAAKLGMLMFRQGKVQDARGHFERAASAAPGDADLHCSLGTVLAQLRRSGPARVSCRRAIAISPAHADAWNTLAVVEQGGGRYAAAVVGYRRCLACFPDKAAALANLGLALASAGQTSGAVPMFRRSLAVFPTATGALSNFALARHQEGSAGDAEALLRRALASEPRNVEALNNLGRVLNAVGKFREAQAAYRSVITQDPENASAHSNLLLSLCYDPDTSSTKIFAEARKWEAAHAAPYYAHAPIHRRTPERDRRLRVGYLSADFRNHPVARNVVGLLEHHDRAAFDIICYAELSQPADEMTDRIRKLSDGWRPTAGLTDVEAAQTVASDGIDVLVTLAAHTGHSRLLVAAHRPAPVQVSFHAVTTTGLRAMDAWLTDAILHPVDNEEEFTEKLIRLPCFYLHMPPPASPDVADPPSARRPYVSFGSCNNPAKLNDSVIDAWAQILRAVPRSRLILKYRNWFNDPTLAQRIRRRFSDRGVGPDQIELRGGDIAQDKHLAIFDDIDIALDTFPFNGSTTTFEALWMGVPVVSLSGRRFVGRVGASVLGALGVSELVADTVEGYVRVAADLARSPERLLELRRSLRSRLTTSRLCDPAAHARSVESAYRSLWHDWCSRAQEPRLPGGRTS
jgi:protein O-GlcNAc transferase